MKGRPNPVEINYLTPSVGIFKKRVISKEEMRNIIATTETPIHKISEHGLFNID